MKRSSKIASALYSKIPKERKRFSLYRQLTGEAFKMLKQGDGEMDIVEKLQVLYVAPLLEYPASPELQYKELKK